MPGMEIILGQKGHFWLQSNFNSLDEKCVFDPRPLSNSKYFFPGSFYHFSQDAITRLT